MNDREFDKALISSIRPLRGYAQLLTRSSHEAEDLSQQTLLKAWAHRTQFQPGTNLRAWLYTIAHNEFCSRYRKARRETGMRDGSELERFGVYPEQYGRLDLADMQKALAKLPPDQREALLLISDAELSYGEAAEKVHVPMGTIKSRANRARSKLAKLLQVASSTEFGPDTMMSAAMEFRPNSR